MGRRVQLTIEPLKIRVLGQKLSFFFVLKSTGRFYQEAANCAIFSLNGRLNKETVCYVLILKH